MREAAHYTVVLAVWPMALLLVGLLIAVGIDSYIRKHQKRIMLIICAPVFRLLIDKKPFNEALFGRDSIVFFVICTVVEVIAYCVRQEMQSDISIDLADVIVTDLPDADTLVNMLWGGALPEGFEIREFGAVDRYHYLVITRPGFVEPEDKAPFAEHGVTPEEVHEAYEALRVDMDAVRAAFIKCLENAELYAPVDPEASLVGQVLSFETTDIDGNAVSSADLFKDNKITMVNVWGSWCHNCMGEMKELTEFHTRLQAKGCGIVGVEYEQKPIDTIKDEVRALLEEKGVNFPNVIMPGDNEIINGISGYPTTFFVDSEGTIIQLCDDVTCAFQPTDAQGMATFSVETQKAYDVHVLMAPDDGVYKTLDSFCDVNISLRKVA